MKLLNNKVVTIGDTQFPVKITNRAMIEYEAISGKTIASFNGTENIVQFFYCTAKAGAKSEGIPFDYTFETFLDVVDEHYTETMNSFTAILAEEGGDGKKQSVKK